MVFQQDGAPPHYEVRAREYLNQTVPWRSIGRREPIVWPARSPDLIPLDFFLWDLRVLFYICQIHCVYLAAIIFFIFFIRIFRKLKFIWLFPAVIPVFTHLRDDSTLSLITRSIVKVLLIQAYLGFHTNQSYNKIKIHFRRIGLSKCTSAFLKLH